MIGTQERIKILFEVEPRKIDTLCFMVLAHGKSSCALFHRPASISNPSHLQVHQLLLSDTVAIRFEYSQVNLILWEEVNRRENFLDKSRTWNFSEAQILRKLLLSPDPFFATVDCSTFHLPLFQAPFQDKETD